MASRIMHIRKYTFEDAGAVMLMCNSPAAGGMMTGKVTRETTNESGSRWSSEHMAGQMYSASHLILPLHALDS